VTLSAAANFALLVAGATLRAFLAPERPRRARVRLDLEPRR
jgi:hypothetical protein